MSMPVAGPGALSQRTDTQAITTPTGLPYGEAGALRAAQQAQPLPQTPRPEVTPLHAPTAHPDQPVTAGAAAGPGPGPEVLSQAPAAVTGGLITQALAKAAASDPTGQLAQLMIQAQQRGY